MSIYCPKLLISCEVSKENLAVVDAEDAAVADAATFAGGQYLDIAPAAIKIVSQRDAILQVENRAVRLPYMEVDRVAGVEHRASGGYVYRASHCELTSL